MPPCLLFEDDHLLVVNKPAGLNTHAPSPFAGEGIYDWLRHREPRWAGLAIIHRLDKETSGVMVFGKSPEANRSLTRQFTQRVVRKKYLLLSDRAPSRREFTAKSPIARAGERYVAGPHGEPAETRFCLSRSPAPHPSLHFIEAAPVTGRTHQIRVHAAENGFPILGDALYGGSPFHRLCLHAAELSLRHPVTDQPLAFAAPVDFYQDASLALRAALVDSRDTTAMRLIHGAADGWPGWHLDRLGDFLLSQAESALSPRQEKYLERFFIEPKKGNQASFTVRAAYHKTLNRQVRRSAPGEASPRFVRGLETSGPFVIRENTLKLELSFTEGYSVGLFLDQRDNRRRLLTGHVAAGFALRQSEPGAGPGPWEMLNTFAYTCGFSVSAAKAGARVASLDLSKKYLEWGRRNFVLNGLDPAGHDFIFGDVFDWLRRLGKKGRRFDVIALDPPTFSQSKEHGAFRVEKDYGKLADAALPLLKPGGVLFASTNASGWEPEKFLASIEDSADRAHRKILQRHYSPQPPDFPIAKSEPAYLKTVWLRLG